MRFNGPKTCILLLFSALCLFGCQSSSTPPPQKSAENPQRIISFVPALTEIAFALDLGPKIVGVSDFDTYPPEVRTLTRVGGLLNPNLEQTLALQPDLLLTAPSHTSVHTLAAKNAIPSIVQPTDSLADIFNSYKALGKAAGIPERAKTEADKLRKALDALQSKTPLEERPKVLLVIGREPSSLKGLYAAGPGSFLDELLTIAGGRNALPKGSSMWPSVSKEYVLAHPPDWILEFAPSGTDAQKETQLALEAWGGLAQLKAVQNKQVRRFIGDHLLLPGPRAVLTVRAIQSVVEPKVK